MLVEMQVEMLGCKWEEKIYWGMIDHTITLDTHFDSVSIIIVPYHFVLTQMGLAIA